jgi:hypothetical protein
MRFFELIYKALIGSWLGKGLPTLIYIPIITILICHGMSIAQTSPIEGRYFAESPRISIQAELRDKRITFIRFDLWTTEGGKAQISSCGAAGGGFSNQVAIDGLGMITGYCTGPFMHGQLSGAQNEIYVSGKFPNIKFEGAGFWGTATATLIPESYRKGYEGEKRLGRFDSTREFFERHTASADSQSKPVQAPETEKQSNAATSVPLVEKKLPIDKLGHQQDEIRKGLEREQQMAVQLRELQEKLQQQTNVAQELQRQLAEAKVAASKVVVQQSGKQALIIGIDQYQSIAKLRNAVADAREVATTLRGFGYTVRLHSDLSERGFKQAIREFIASVNPGDEVIVFYAGHGIQMGGLNYLLPTDTKGDSERQVRDEAIQLQRILDDLSEVKPSFALIIIDACRDNPFKGQGRNIGGRGLSPTTAASGQMIIFSAGTNQQALDVLGPNDRNANSVFTRVLVTEMKKPNLSVDRLARNVRAEVVRLAKSVGHEQVPALYDQSIGEFYLNRK